jgi:hypothetical protein
VAAKQHATQLQQKEWVLCDGKKAWGTMAAKRHIALWYAKTCC